jgi:hypothetical protein
LVWGKTSEPWAKNALLLGKTGELWARNALLLGKQVNSVQEKRKQVSG